MYIADSEWGQMAEARLSAAVLVPARSVYGKMGLWEQAVKVLTLMKSEVTPWLA
jgi:hypothetical protein